MTPGRPLRLLVCDDAPEMRAMLEATLADHLTIAVVGQAENGEQATVSQSSDWPHPPLDFHRPRRLRTQLGL